VDPYRDLLGAPSGPCPRCAEPLHPLSRGKTRVFRCKTCGGVLADRTTLERFAGDDRADLQALADEATRAPPGPATARGPIECPWCQASMRAVVVPAAKCTIVLNG
jgi:Zn-finger nucleic acid-binding protein